MGSRPGVLGGFAFGAALAAVVVVFALANHSSAHRAPAAAPTPTAAASRSGPPTARHARPDIADYNVIVGERRSVSGAAAETHRAIVSCRQQTHAAFTSGLRSFNDCTSIPLRHNIYRARVETPLLTVGLVNLKAGRCRALAQGVGADLSDLGDLSQAWFDLYEQGRSDLAGRQLRSLRTATRTTISQLLALTSSAGAAARTRELTRACRPRPYDPAEHVGAALVLDDLQSSRLGLNA